VYLRGQSPGHPGKDGSATVGECGKGLSICRSTCLINAFQKQFVSIFVLRSRWLNSLVLERTMPKEKMVVVQHC